MSLTRGKWSTKLTVGGAAVISRVPPPVEGDAPPAMVAVFAFWGGAAAVFCAAALKARAAAIAAGE